MVSGLAEADTFAEEDQTTYARLEALYGLESSAFNLRNQINEVAVLVGVTGGKEEYNLLEAL